MTLLDMPQPNDFTDEQWADPELQRAVMEFLRQVETVIQEGLASVRADKTRQEAEGSL